MKYRIKIIIVLFMVICVMYFFFNYVFGWLKFSRNTDTPTVYLNQAIIKGDEYTTDSIEVMKQLKCLFIKQEDFFYNKSYNNETKIIIDSILHSPDLNRLAVFVITKSPTLNQSIPKEYDYFYDDTCYLGQRQKDTIFLNWIGPVFTNSSSYQNVSNDIREACFRTFITKDTNDVYEYNLDDIRFWNSRIWKQVNEEKQRKEEFEKEKKEHPERVYEPKK
jgi:hypothetical protein